MNRAARKAFMLSAAAAAALCSSAVSAAERMSAFFYSSEDEFVARIQQAIEDRAQDLGITVSSSFANLDLLLQMEQVEDELTNKTQALLVNPVDTGNGAAVISRAKQDDVPVVLFNRLPSVTMLNSYDKAWYVGSNPAQAGQYQGEMVVDFLKRDLKSFDRDGDGTISFILLKGEQEHPDTSVRSYYCMQTIYESDVKFRQLAALNANWDGETARSYIELFAGGNDLSGVELIIANNDAMALGAIRALQAHGFNKGEGSTAVPVFGIDANADALFAIEQGWMAGTVLNPAEEIGSIVVDVAAAAADGKTVDAAVTHGYGAENSKLILVPYAKVTREP